MTVGVGRMDRQDQTYVGYASLLSRKDALAPLASPEQRQLGGTAEKERLMKTTTTVLTENDLTSRMRRLLLAVNDGSGNSAALNGAIARFTSLESKRARRRALADAREQKDEIVARLAFLAELDEITERESDISVFGEIALLFDEISAAAAAAASAVRTLVGYPNRGGLRPH